MRLIFATLGVAVVGAAAVAATAGPATAWLTYVSVVGAGVFAGSNWQVLRAGRSSVLNEAATVAAVLLVSVALPDPTMTVSLTFSVVMFRAFYGGHGHTVVRVLAHFVAYGTALGIAHEDGRLDVSPILAALQPAPALVVSAAAMRVMYKLILSRESAERRQSVLLRAATRLLEAADEEDVSAVAWQTQTELIGDAPVCVVLLTWNGGRATVGWATVPTADLGNGAVTDLLSTLDLTAGPATHGQVEALQPLMPHATTWTLIPVPDGDDRGRVIAIGSSGGVDDDLMIASRLLLQQTALAHAAVVRRAVLQRDALHDPMTQLPNRQLLEMRMAECAADGRPATLLYLDLDGFKAVNDAYGHHRGDQLLRILAERLHHAVKRRDLVARIGGDEFAVLLCDPPQLEVEAVARRIEREVRRPVTLGEGVTVSVGVSIGIRAIDPDVPAAELLRDADSAMYAVKRQRRAGASALT